MNPYRIVGILYVILVVACIAAKLLGFIHGSWWIALIPLWVPVALIVIAVVVGIALLGRESANGGNPFQ